MEYGILQPDGTVKKVTGVEASAHYATPRAHNSRGIEQTRLADGRYFISTVFLMLNHAFIMGHEIWFETLVFDNEPEDGSGERKEIDGTRYSTIEEARAGHKRYVAETEALIESQKKKEPEPTARAPIGLTQRKMQV